MHQDGHLVATREKNRQSNEMDIQTLHESLRELPNATVGPSVSQVKKLAELVDGDAPLQPFLEQLLPLLCELFGGISAVVWMKAQGAPGAVFGVRYKFEEVINTVPEQTQHEKLVQIAYALYVGSWNLPHLRKFFPYFRL